jgi:hypothetical protein
MDDGGRFPRGLPGTGSLLLMCVLVTACCVWCGLCLRSKRAWQQFCAWISRAGS